MWKLNEQTFNKETLIEWYFENIKQYQEIKKRTLNIFINPWFNILFNII